MDPFTLIYLAMSGIGVGRSILSNERMKDVKKKYSNVLQQIANDAELMNQLEQAYARKDSRLMNQILNASPFSGDFQKMKNDLNANKAKIEQLAKDKVSLSKKAAQINDDYNSDIQKAQGTGSLIGDLINGGIDTKTPIYSGFGYKENDLMEANK